jgi:hypothetical protein
MQAPLFLQIVRLVLLGIITLDACFYGRAGDMLKLQPMLLAITSGTFFVFTIILTFIRKKFSLYYITLFLVLAPAAFWIVLDKYELSGTWWEWLLMFPIQMTLPIILSYLFVKDPVIKSFFLHKGNSK